MFAFVGGIGYFVVNMWANGAKWTAQPYNGHIYANGSTLSAGTITDRTGMILAESRDGSRVYAEKESVRRALLHTVGDSSGYISTSVQAVHRTKLMGYNIFTGLNETIFSGIGNNQFGPALNVTRGMFVTTLYSSAGSPDVELSNFSDVAPTAWYAKAVAWASQQGIVSGIGNNKFGPDMPITREQIALILFNYADGVSPGTEMFVRMAYPDAKDIHDWALTAFTWAMNKELISGKSGNILDPLATATRAEVAVIMQNFVNLSK